MCPVLTPARKVLDLGKRKMEVVSIARRSDPMISRTKSQVVRLDISYDILKATWISPSTREAKALVLSLSKA